MSGYFYHIKQAIRTLWSGFTLTLRYLGEARRARKPIGIADPTYFDVDTGTVTLQYPYESLPVPDNGRYRLHNEIDDCIVCDKCAKICPVNCIEIEPIKSAETIGVTSDGTPKRIYAAKFDIDMAKCCFCGLCTTVCPTECLTMTKTYDFSVYDISEHNYAFAEMSLADITLKRKEQEESEARKAATTPKVESIVTTPSVEVAEKPAFRPRVVMKPKVEAAPAPKLESSEPEKPKPVFRPKPIVKRKDTGDDSGS